MNALDPPTDPAALFAALVASSDDAIVGKDLDGTVISWNGGAERIFGWSAEEMVGANIRKIIPADRLGEEDAIIASIAQGRHVPTFETVRQRKDGTQITVAVTVSPVVDAQGQVVAASKIARDISEQVKVRSQLDASERRFQSLADNIDQLAWIADGEGWIFWYNQRWLDYTGTTLEEMEGWGWQKVHHPDHVEAVTALFAAHIESGDDWEDTFPLLGADGHYRWFLSRAKPIRDPDGRIVNWFGTNTDVTEMRDAEQRIELLLEEVNHRSKNMLSIIQSLARRTDASHPDFVERLEQRIRSIAANQDVLVSRSWSSIPITEMVEAQLRPLGEMRGQVEVSGPDVRLSPGAAEALAMAINEMITNAIRYGALSTPQGRVAIAWSIDDGAADSHFAISWTERGGPPASEPEEAGFGTRILVDVPRVKLDATVETAYPPEGFRWSLRSAASAVA